jgi:hypothetical protein
MTLVQLVAEQGEGAVKHMPEGLKANPESMAEALRLMVATLF